MQKIQIYLEDSLLEEIKEVTKNLNISISEFIKQNLKEGLKKYNIEDTPKEKILNDLKEAIKEVKLAEEGKIKLIDARELLNEL